MASTARQAAKRMLNLASRSDFAHIDCRRGGHCLIGSTSQTPSSVLDAQCRIANRQGIQQKRTFHSTEIERSAWPLGRDASPTSTTKERAAAEAEKAYKSNNSIDSKTLPPGERAVTVRDLHELKEKGESIAMLTAYDYPSSLGIRSGAVDICLVGDSLTNVALGHRTTHPLSLEAMIHHVQAVARGLRHPMLNQYGVPPVPLLIADVPMGYAEISLEEGSKAAVNLIKQGGADGVKMEGGMELVPLVERLASFGIPVMAHIGLQPQRSSSGSALNLAGRSADEAFELLQTAIMMQEAGAFACLLECIPARVGEEITKRLQIPTIGIGAGPKTDGQVLVMDDVLGECNSPLYVLAGLDESKESNDTNPMQPSIPPKSALNTPQLPRFVRNFVAPLTGGSSVGSIRMAAVRSYVDAVKEGTFPVETESYKMKKEEWAKFKELLAMQDRAIEREQASLSYNQSQSEEDFDQYKFTAVPDSANK